jgi:hypothetical protein
MIPMIHDAWNALVHDEMAARRWIRGLLVGFGVGGAGAVGYAPEKWRFWLYLAAGLSACVGGLISIGQQNEPKTPAAP